MATIQAISPDEVLEALRLWHGGEPAAWPLAHLRLTLQVAREAENYETLAGAGPAARNRAVLNRALAVLQDTGPEAHDLLRERFEQRRSVMAIANSLNIAEPTLHYRQRQAVAQLTEILLALEAEASATWQERMATRLAVPSYTRLVGVEEARAVLLERLVDETGSFFAAIDGIGGIGKTALADQTVRDLLHTRRFDDVAWVTAKQTHLSAMGRLQVESGRPALTFPMLLDELVIQFDLPAGGSSQLGRQRQVKQYLRENACLVVIDNLETAADYHSLLPELRQWQDPSKFLLTSRRRLLDEPDVYSLSLRELSPAAAFELIRLEAKRAGFRELEMAGDADLQQIYDTVGGNPLALKLTIGQLRFHSLPQVLARFAGSRAADQEGLFDYIYREIWETLGDKSKETLLALTQAGESGFTLEHLVAITRLPETTLQECLEELILLSLVDLGGTLMERRYRLHRLTEVFLLRMFAPE
ncbi:MAG: NB-ARC domain-containing protein [Chloroflexi bacterium]|nr:NB-ARC domain-containing protein [Chloroflexota bacterium]MCI0578641.1 NB-ARC domain-containing protein [Chloroflexota bacterium]MCI0647214.1 NB-ARC domain-containing protein [Chloroflexota bacterium]MCI0728940.1 NB-ARC domain-containing protein [Chloroflexota bacterium]